jgi:hypothetical protein
MTTILNCKSRYANEHLTQQNDEKHIPTYTQGTKTPEMSPPSKDRTEPCSLGKLFRFQPDSAYLCSTSDFTSGENFGKPLPKVPVSKSAPYTTCMRTNFFDKLEDSRTICQKQILELRICYS